MRHNASCSPGFSSLCGICLPKGKVLSDTYGHLNFKLMRATARALLARSPPILAQLDSG